MCSRGIWIVVSPATMTPAIALGVTDLASWTKFVASEDHPTETRILYHTLPDDRPDPPRPKDLAIESAEPPAVTAGADPAQVGPGGNSVLSAHPGGLLISTRFAPSWSLSPWPGHIRRRAGPVRP